MVPIERQFLWQETATPFYSTTELNEDNRTHTAAFRIDDFYCVIIRGLDRRGLQRIASSCMDLIP